MKTLKEFLSKHDDRQSKIPSERQAGILKKTRPMGGKRILQRYHEEKVITLGKTLTGNTSGSVIVVNPNEPNMFGRI